jgi:hypothetical protein
MESSEKPTPRSIWSARVIGWITLLFGISSGFVVASINWFKMGKKAKAALHLGIGLFIACLNALFIQDHLRLSYYHSINEKSLRVIASLALTFIAIAYLYTTTRKDIEALQQTKEFIRPWNWFFAALIGLVSFVSFSVLDNTVFTYSIYSVQDHFYCDVLKPEMTISEVEATLDKVGTNLFRDAKDFTDINALSRTSDIKPAYFRIVIFFDTKNEKLEKALSHKFLGFDSNDKMIWRSVQCP